MENLSTVPHKGGLGRPSVNKYPRIGYNFDSELNVKEGKTSQISTGTTYMTGQYQGGGYSGGGIGVGTGVDYSYYGGNDMGI